MREILFRAKSNYGNVGEWEYGLVAQPHVTEDGIVTSYYFTKLCEDGHSSQRTVSANTIGQYTGLTDKNGKKIFEGDIVVCELFEEIGQIAYHESEAMFMVEFDTWLTDFDHMYGTDLEVIGNIHDNPELLGGKEE